MHHAARSRPVHGNWIWLVTAALTATVLTGAALRYAATSCPAAASGPATRLPGAAMARTPPATGAAVTPAATGEAVFYDPGSVAGSCSLGPFGAHGLYVALPPQQYRNGAACGTYLDVRGPHGGVRAEVVDLCPSCAATSIDLDRAAFVRVAGPDAGSATVTYRRAANPPLRHRIWLRVSTTVSGRLALQVIHHGNRLTSVAVAPPGARWLSLTLGPNDFWVSPTSAPAGPVTVRITDTAGHQVTLPRVPLTPGTTIHTRTWMYRPATSPATSTTLGRNAPRRIPAGGAASAAADPTGFARSAHCSLGFPVDAGRPARYRYM
ncbi:MAG TPA: expansin EXLX1 family cellulose-binding protein [Streptosporangiaceae bacterium]|nr:expansin EXLX1 family cellulose-binding protein [Streptosporangiaceae bacterium]